MVCAAPLPGRPSLPALVPPAQVPQRSLYTTEGRAALIHALCHIEFNAINLALDILWRFAAMPPAFYADWLQVAAEEALHFELLRKHLADLGHGYGDFVAHNGLWEMAEKTKDSLLARLALVPRMLEARGLDASPAIRHKLQQVGDLRGAEILNTILTDEIGHVRIGNHWYHWLCQQQGLHPIETEQALAQSHEAPRLRGPFNLEARQLAGFSKEELALLRGL